MADVQLSLDVGCVALIVSKKACSASGPSSIFSMVSIGLVVFEYGLWPLKRFKSWVAWWGVISHGKTPLKALYAETRAQPEP